VKSSAARPRQPEDPDLVASVLDGLGKPQKEIASKWLYDAEGSRLFDRICEVEDYYPTRTEVAILEANAHSLRPLVPDGAALVELGSGSSLKTRLMLDAVSNFAAYVPVDISAQHLRHAAAAIAADYPALAVQPVVGDFTARLALPPSLRDVPKLLFFPGSTIGNFDLDGAAHLLGRLRGVPAVQGLVIGIDLEKDVARLLRAYDDSDGVTAAFSLNLLHRLNRELGADFDPDGFRHEARWNRELRRVEIFLVSRQPQQVEVAGRRFAFAEGETIHTENSQKFTLAGFRDLAAGAGWTSHAAWVDDDALFSVHVLTPDGA